MRYPFKKKNKYSEYCYSACYFTAITCREQLEFQVYAFLQAPQWLKVFLFRLEWLQL